MTVYIQVTTGTVHTTERCSVARRSTRVAPIPVQLNDEVQGALADGTYRWCAKCHG